MNELLGRTERHMPRPKPLEESLRLDNTVIKRDNKSGIPEIYY